MVNNIPLMKTINEVSEIVGLKKYHIRQLVLQNKVKFIKSGKKYIINFDSLIEYLNNGEVTTEEPNSNISKIRKVEL